MKSLICKQENKFTTIGKVYIPTLHIAQNGYRSITIVLDNGSIDTLDQDGNLCCGGHNGIAKFSVIDCDIECYLGQPSITKAESIGISILSALEMLSLNEKMKSKTKEALYRGDSLEFAYPFWETVKIVIRQNKDHDKFLSIALEEASKFAEYKKGDHFE